MTRKEREGMRANSEDESEAGAVVVSSQVETVGGKGGSRECGRCYGQQEGRCMHILEAAALVTKSGSSPLGDGLDGESVR